MTAPDALAGIQRLHEADVAAVKAGDLEALLGLWTEDAVALPPDGEAIQGRTAIEEMIRSGLEQLNALELLKYTQDFQNVSVVGDIAHEWALYRTRYRSRETGEVFESSGKLLRVLQADSTGVWRVSRSMWTVDEG